jgi:hypothetical protein
MPAYVFRTISCKIRRKLRVPEMTPVFRKDRLIMGSARNS